MTHVHYRFRFGECAARALVFEVEDIPIPILSLVDLREMKVLSGRPQDLRDVILMDEFMAKSGLN